MAINENPFAKYYIDDSQDNPFAKYYIDESSKKQNPNSLSPRIKVPNALQNNPLGGLLTGLGNEAIGMANFPHKMLSNMAYYLNKYTGLDKLVGQPDLNTDVVGEIENPEYPTRGYNNYKTIGEYAPLAIGGLGLVNDIRKLPKFAELIGKAPKAMSKLSDYLSIRPGKAAKNLTKDFSKEAIAPRMEKSLQTYEESINPHYEAPFTKESKYLSDIDPASLEGASPKVRKYHGRLLENLNTKNAHKLKKQITSEVYKELLPKVNSVKGLDTAGSDRLNAYLDMMPNLKEDLISTLKDINPESAEKFIAADKYFAKEVHPYQTVKNLLNNISHEKDFFGEKAAKAILKRAASHPKDIPEEALKAAKGIRRKQKNLIVAGSLGAILGAKNHVVPRSLLHLLGL